MRVGRSGDEKVHYPRARSAPGGRHGRGKLAIAGSHGLIDRQSVEPALQIRDPPEASGPDCGISGDEHAKVEFG